jgi:antitoxin YefM
MVGKRELDATNAFPHALKMTTVSATKARSMIYQLLDDAAQSHEPIQITGKRANGVLVSEADWRSIQETLYLVSIAGMRESIRTGLKVPLSDCSKDLRW